MNNSEKVRRIQVAISETAGLLEKAEKRYHDTIVCLKMEVAENGNNKGLNKPWVEYALQDKKAVEGYKSHIDRLQEMLSHLTMAD